MGVSALRVAACAGVLVGGLVLGLSAAGIGSADPGFDGRGPKETESSNGVNNDRPRLGQIIRRILSEHRSRAGRESRTVPQAKIGSEPDSGSPASESNAASVAEPADAPADEPAPELVPDNERGADPAGYSAGGDGGGGAQPAGTGPAQPPAAGGSDYTGDTAAVVAPEAEKKPVGSDVYPFPFYWLEFGARGGDWWNADRIISRLGRAFSPYSATTPEPEPEPEPVPVPEPAPAPAFRGPAPAAPAPEAPAPEAPAPDPVLDASGGIVAGGGSDYQATGFGAAPVLSAPAVVMPVPPPVAARIPEFPAAAPPGLGSAAARGGAEPAVSVHAVRQAATPEQAPARTESETIGQTRLGYTEYLRRPGLPQLAGAALPGVAGILLLTIGGGVIGYRQAEAGRMIRSTGAARYLP
jgi:hypothetical protein